MISRNRWIWENSKVVSKFLISTRSRSNSNSFARSFGIHASRSIERGGDPRVFRVSLGVHSRRILYEPPQRHSSRF